MRSIIRCFKSSFNSRTPGGVRPPRSLPTTALMSPFQFTHPGRGATQRLHRKDRTNQFQFTHPGRGATKPPRYVFRTPL